MDNDNKEGTWIGRATIQFYQQDIDFDIFSEVLAFFHSFHQRKFRWKNVAIQ